MKTPRIFVGSVAGEMSRVPRSAALVLLTGMLLACGGAGEAVWAESSELAPVRSGCEPDYPPYCIVTPDNQADGLSVELLRAALQAVGRDVVFKTGPWAELKQELAEGQLEVLPLVGRTPERESQYDFTIPYITMHGALFIRDDTADIRTWRDLQDKRVAVMKGDNAEEYVRRAGISDRIITPPTFTVAFQMLVAGQADAVIAQKMMGLSLLKRMGVTNIRVVGKPNEEFTQVFCFAVREGNRELLSLLNEGLAIVMAGGLKRQLEHKWMGVDARETARARVILYGGDRAFPPYEFLDNKGRPAGFNIDLARAVAREIGADISFQLGLWSEVRRKIENGDLDLACMFYSASRERLVDFSVPHTLVYQAVFAGDVSPPYRRIDDLQRRQLSVQKGDIMHDYALERGLGDKLAVTATSEDALALLAEGRVDYALGSHFQGLYWLKQRGWKHLRAVDTQLLGTEYCYVVPKGNTALRDLLNDGLKQLKESGEYRNIYKQWLGVLEPDYEWRRITSTVLLLLVAISLIVVIAFGIILVLRRQVARRTRELTFERAFLDRVINAIADPVFVKDDKRRFVIVNDAFCAIVGRSREALIGDDGDEMFPPDQVAVFRKMDAAVLETGKESLNEENLSDLSTGKVHTIVTRKSRYTDPAGNRFLVGVIRDFTERKAVEAQLRVQIAAMEATAEVILITDRNEIITWVNQAFTAQTGYTAADIIGRPASILSPEQVPDARPAHIQTALSAGKVWRGELVSRRKDGSLYTEEITITPVPDEAGVVTHRIAIAKDITERKRMEGALREQQKLASMGTLARGMAHEINNPIMGVMNYAELIKEQAAGNAALVEYAAEILTEGRRVARMTQSLLGFTEQKANPAFETATHENLVAAVLPLAAEAARAKGIALSCDIPADLPPVSCRRSQIELVVTALLTNAMEAFDQGALDAGRLGCADKKIVVSAREVVASEQLSVNSHGVSVIGDRLSAEESKLNTEHRTLNTCRRLRLTVEDNGPGIPAEIQERSFDPFFTTKDRTKHSGLGLWISRSIAQEHGGELTYESPSTALPPSPGSFGEASRAGEVGHGARFHLDLPVAQSREKQEDPGLESE